MKKSGAVSREVGHRSGIFFASIVLGSATIFCPVGSCQSAGGGSAQNNTAGIHARILILQPRVRIADQTSGRDLEGASDAVRSGFVGVLSRAFEDNGYMLRFDPASVTEWEAKSAGLKALQADYDSRFCSHLGSIPTGDCSMPKKASLRDDISKIADIDAFDVVVLARGDGNVRTLSKARTAAGEVLGGGDRKPLAFTIEIVDVKTGLSVYHCGSSAGGDYLGATESQLSGPIQECLAHYFSGEHKHFLGFGSERDERR